MGIGNSSTLRKIIPTTMVDKIINCTNREMYVYGTSGTLLRLAPRELDLSRIRLHNSGVLYVVDKTTERQLLGIDRKFEKIIVHPSYYGNGLEGQDIYKFSRNDQPVVPITDRCGHNGDKVYR